MSEPKDLCVQPAKGPILASESSSSTTKPIEDVLPRRIVARVGKPAPDFEANAYVDGGFKNVKLSDYRGRWVVLCFYPGDFTFV